MRITTNQAIQRLSERLTDNSQDISQKNLQRRTNFTDLHGIEYTRMGDGGAPATFYISVSPDLEYYERFEFKLIIQPFMSTVTTGGIQSAVVQVDPMNLAISGSQISPNPHEHTTQPHTHNVMSGVTLINTTANDFTIKVEGIDVTPYLMAQHGGNWINGEGIYPDEELGSPRDVYDILQVACDMNAEGKTQEVETLLKSGYKKVEISSASPFQVTMALYLKISHVNR